MYLSLGGHGSLLTPNKQQIEARNQKLTFRASQYYRREDAIMSLRVHCTTVCQEAEAELNYPSSEAVTRNDGSRQGANWKTCMPQSRHYAHCPYFKGLEAYRVPYYLGAVRCIIQPPSNSMDTVHLCIDGSCPLEFPKIEKPPFIRPP
ncbi:hypothetical protein MGG_17049 [Pyricularia oryzae 70-15]|uniref:Uncharacterized protein n=1 Tax=Pyricularia oryzae (strain 70-15 / ATCC MYA-4617 / FGSC 8958) TaxID=242507 RepID=G4N6F9_PYRO7|nr:uncharacterized protein MGG_17049 [Pyricularia oryzae 70-15]EHA49829.1 hypothetical protein MGG_17049 [Pyricularia oryzae 70-15]